MFSSIVEIFPDFTLYVNVKTPKHTTWHFYQDKNCWTWWHFWRNWRNESWRGDVFMSQFLRRFWSWKDGTQSLQLCSRKSQRNNSGREAWLFIQQLKVFSQRESTFWVNLEKKKIADSNIFTHTKTIPCWIDRNLCAPKATWQGWRIFSTKLTSSSRLAEKGWKQSGTSTSWNT